VPLDIPVVLYIHPIKQGLKLDKKGYAAAKQDSSLHTSNKTRIETSEIQSRWDQRYFVLYIHPIKQGLKHSKNFL